MSDLCSSTDCNVCLLLANEPSTQTSVRSAKEFEIPKLQKCGGCQLIQYCSAEHQKLDWPIHKDFCRAVQRILKTYDTNHPLALMGQPKCGQEMRESIQLLKMLMPIALKRPMQSHEHELTSFPAYCAVCYSLKRSQYVCTICRGVSYCSMEHAKQHTTEHREICNMLELYYCRHKVIPIKAENVPFHAFLQPCSEQSLKNFNLIEAIEFSTKVPMPKVPTLSLKHYHHFAYVAKFSAVGTICYALAQLKTQTYEDNKITIFIIGATDEELHYFRGMHTRFFFLHYPKIKTLSLCYIGPEAIHESGLNSQTYQFFGSTRTVYHITHRGMFQDYMKDHEIKPTMIIAFNCGFSEFPFCNNKSEYSEAKNDISNETKKESPWYEGLCRLALAHLIPIFFTSYTCQEAEADYVALMKVVKNIDDKLCIDVCRILNLIPNPFRDIRPLLNWETTDKEKIFYRNGYIQGVITEIKERERFI